MAEIIAISGDSKHKIIRCPYCECVISYQLNEVWENDLGEFIIPCPNCEKEIGVNDYTPLTFPDTFHHTCKKNGAYHLSKEEVQDLVNKTKRKLYQTDTGDFVYYSTGDTCVIGLKSTDTYLFLVTQDYYEEEIDVN